MESFLSHVAAATQHLPPLDTLVVFPTQRACYDYKILLGRLSQSPVMLPTVVPIGELLEKLASPPVADDLQLLIELHKTYGTLFDAPSFGEFMPFGEQVLDVFNEIDRQLVDADALFRQLLDLKQIDEAFAGDEEEQFEQFKRFWSSFLNTPHTPLQSNFLKYWAELGPLYTAYRERLSTLNIAYEGLAWKLVSEQIAAQTYFKRFEHLVFAGFYALNRTEEVILDYLKEALSLHLFRDADRLYTENKLHEAGRYFKRGILSTPDIPWTGDYFSQPKLSYEVKACNGIYATSLQLCHDLKKLISDKPDARPAVVLTDENLLFPLLQCGMNLGLPLNPSMGFSLSLHPVFRLLKLVAQCRTMDQADFNLVFLERHITTFTDEPFIRSNHSEAELAELNIQIRDWLLFSDKTVVHEGDYLLQFLKSIRFNEKSWMYTLHANMLVFTEAAIERLSTFLNYLDSRSWWEILLARLRSERISFETSPEGISVMGFLETRVLDFESVYIATLNEGTLPSSSVTASLIPYALRKAYRLPCREEQQSVTAYHFYRLLQRAKHINLYYNTQLNSMGGGEKSRYLYQLNLDVIRKAPPVTLNYISQSNKLTPTQSSGFSIPKTVAVLQKLNAHFSDTPENREKRKGFSASVLRQYIDCPMKFYLNKIAGLQQNVQPTQIDKPTFGTILHRAMELAYPEGERISADFIRNRLKDTERLVEVAIQEMYGKPVTFGHDFLMKGVLIQLVEAILKFDLKEPDFLLMGNELKVHSSVQLDDGSSFLLKGSIDRLERTQNGIRVLDYKTGSDVIDKETFDFIFNDKKGKTAFQLYFYALLVHKVYESTEPIRSAIMKLKTKEVLYINNGEPITASEIEAFEAGVRELIADIMNPAIPFTMTEEIQNCKYCDFKVLCQRTEA